MCGHPEADDYEAAAPELARAADVAGFTPATIVLHTKGAPHPLEGFIVDGTEGTLAIDERVKPRGMEPGRWFITHVPSGFRMDIFPDWHCATREGAAARARRLFAEWTKLGFDFNAEEASEIVEQFNRLTTDEQLALRARVACS